MASEEVVTPAMRATGLLALDAIIDLMDERDRERAENNRLRLALGAALPALERYGEHRLCALIRTAAGDCSENALSVCGPVLVVRNP